MKKGRLIVREMTELMALELVEKHLVTKKMELTINYDRESLQLLRRGASPRENVYAVRKTGRPYQGTISIDPYGRPKPKHAHGTGNLDRYTNSTRRIMQAMMEIFDRVVDPDLLIRRVTIAAVNLYAESEAPREKDEQMDLFTDYAKLEQERETEHAADEKEKKIQQATLLLQKKYGKNAVLKGMNLLEGGTTIERNGQIGGHRAGE